MSTEEKHPSGVTNQGPVDISGLLHVYRSGKYTDLNVTCGDRTFDVHRVIVCTQNDVLAAMVDGQFKEAHTGVIKLVDDPIAVDCMFQYMYTGDYNIPVTKEQPSNEFIIQAEIFRLVDKYCVPGLGPLIVGRFDRALPVVKYDDSGITKKLDNIVEQTFQKLLEAAETIYSCAPESTNTLRSSLKTHLHKFAWTIMKYGAQGTKDELKSIFSNVPELAFDVLSEYMIEQAAAHNRKNYGSSAFVGSSHY